MFIATVPATTRLLTTVDNVRLRGSVPEDLDDETVEVLIASGSAAVETYLQRVLARETGIQTERIDAYTSRGNRIFLERTPVVSIASIVEDGTTLDTDDYEVDLQTGELRRLVDDVYGSWTGKVVITYTGGYLLPEEENANLPADIEAAVILNVGAANALITQATAQSSGAAGIKRKSVLNGLIDITYFSPAESSTTGSVSTSVGGTVTALLEPYRRVYA
jgi:hypothetical protein